MLLGLLKCTEENESRPKSIKWWFWRAALGVVGLWVLCILIVPIGIFCLSGDIRAALGTTVQFLGRIFGGDLFLPFSEYFKWLWEYMSNEPRHHTWGSFFAWKLPLIPIGAFIIYEIWLPTKNPYYFAPQTFGDGRKATLKDLKQFGLLDGTGLYFGTGHGAKMKLPDTRSVFVCGMPGCGKTAGLTIPAVLEGDNACMIIHDPKGEIAKATSGYRSKLGPLFKLNWGASDDLEKGVFWPSWNPIGGKNLPSLQNGREGYIDTMISFLIPDGPKSADPYWVKAGRGCLTGLTGYLCGKVDQAKANDYFLYRLDNGGLDEDDYTVLLSYYQSMRDFPEVKQAIKNVENRTITKENYLPVGKWGIIPKNWRGQDASFSMLLDILSNTQMKFTKELKERRQAQDVTSFNTDPWKMILEDIVLETAYYGYGRRTLLELTQVEALPEKQRGSVISMALSGINIFKNSAVRARTSLNDFDYEQLRGVKDPVTGEYKPITIYLSVPMEDIGSSMLVSSLFINMATQNVMEFGPNEGKMGPFPINFILDDFQLMPALTCISDGITFGRSKANSFFVSVQDWHQINSKYDEDTTNIIMSSAAVKLIKRQNNTVTRNALSKGIQTLTKVVHSYSRNEGRLDLSGPLIGTKKMGDFGGFNMSWTHKIKTQADTVFGGSGMLSMAPEKEIALYAGHYNRPIDGCTPMFFKHPEYKEKSSIPPSSPMPKEIKKDLSDLAVVARMQFGED